MVSHCSITEASGLLDRFKTGPWLRAAVQRFLHASKNWKLAEVKVHDRGAPSSVFSYAGAIDLAGAPFDGHSDLANRRCRLEPVLGVGVGIFTRRHLSLRIIKNDSRPPVREVELSRWSLNGKHFVEITGTDTFPQLFGTLKPSSAIGFGVIPVDGAFPGHADLGACGQSEKNIEIKDEQRRSVLVWPFGSPFPAVDVGMRKKDAVPDAIFLVELVRGLL